MCPDMSGFATAYRISAANRTYWDTVGSIGPCPPNPPVSDKGSKHVRRRRTVQNGQMATLPESPIRLDHVANRRNDPEDGNSDIPLQLGTEADNGSHLALYRQSRQYVHAAPLGH